MQTINKRTVKKHGKFIFGKVLKTKYKIFITLLTISLILFSCKNKNKTTAKSQSTVAKISFILGSVNIYRADVPGAIKAKRETPVYAGDFIKTGKNSRAEISIQGGGIIKLDSSSNFKMQKIGTKDGLPVIDCKLFKGRSMTHWKKSGDKARLNFRTPTTVAAVRGTVFLNSVKGFSYKGFPFGIEENLDDTVQKIALLKGRLAVKNQKDNKAIILDEHYQLIQKGRQSISKAALTKESLENMKSLIMLESDGTDSIGNVFTDIQKTSEFILQSYGLNIAKELSEQKKKLQEDNAIGKSKVKKIEKTGESIEKDYNKDDLKLKQKLF